MNKKQARQEKLEKHYATLEKLARKCGSTMQGKKISLHLWKMEKWAHKASEDYCNGTMTQEAHELIINQVEKEVKNLFHNKLKGFFVNSDPRGYSLKIQDDVLKSEYSSIGLERDWGGYGLLSPEII